MTEPTFSIVIPTYQRRDAVCDTVRLLARQRYAGTFNVIVVVDGSSDGTAKALRELDLPFSLDIIEQENGGAAHARNRGAKAARGDVILFIDDDMTCAPNLLEQHARLYAAGADAITGEITPYVELPAGISPEELPKYAPESGDEPATAFDIFTGQLSVKRQLFEDLGGFDERFTAERGYGNEDLDFGARLVRQHDVRINPAAVTMHRDPHDPWRYLKRAEALAAADALFAERHPELAAELYRRRGSSLLTTRVLYRPLGSVPILAPVLAGLLSAAAQALLRTPMRTASSTKRLLSIAYGASYWMTVRSARRSLRRKQRVSRA